MPLPKDVVPRFYQKESFTAIQAAIRQHRGVCFEAPTGSGKSIILAMIINAVMEKNDRWKKENRVYVIVHQKFLLDQMDSHLEKWRVPHGLIKAGKYERKGVNVHVCTYQSLINRPPEKCDLIIIDEAHRSGAKSYLSLCSMFPNSKIVGVTASPERNDGKGLKYNPELDPNDKNQGLFDILIKCPESMIELTELGYISPIRYYAPPLPGIESVSISMGDYNPKEIEKFLKDKGVYGDAINHYEKIAPGTKCLVFCKSVASCYSFAESLASRGYRPAVIEGKNTDKERKKSVELFHEGKYTHLVTCKLVLEGFDLPSIESVLDLAPVLSRGLWHQKKGRLARPAPGKDYGIYIDCVGNVAQCTTNGNIYEVVDWKFDGTGYNKKNRSQEAADQYCPLCYAYIPPPGTICPDCGAEKTKTKKPEKKAKHMDGELVELKPVPLSEREGEDKREISDKIAAAIVDNNIEELIKIGLQLTNKAKLPFWIYYKLCEKKGIRDIPLIYRIQRSLGYKSTWVYMNKNRFKIIGEEE